MGRLAFPLFAFLVAEGYEHTRDFDRYFRRMLLFAVVSEIPFNLMTGGSLINPFHQNVMFTFCIALLLLRTLDAEEPALVDDLIETTGIPTRRVLSALTVLEIENLVHQHSGKRYTRVVTLTE